MPKEPLSNPETPDFGARLKELRRGVEPPLGMGLNFYSDPRTLTDEMVDPLIRKAVFRINESGWIWTAESCQGHPGDKHAWAGNERPMIRLIYAEGAVGFVLGLMHFLALYESPEAHNGLMAVGLEIWRYPRAVSEWEETLVYVRSDHRQALAFWERFAEAVNA